MIEICFTRTTSMNCHDQACVPTQTELEGTCRVPEVTLDIPSNSNRVPGVYTTSTVYMQGAF